MSESQSFAVLVVDDEPDLVSSIRRILRLDGYRVEFAASLRDLTSRLDLTDFFAILLDRKLPDGMSDTLLPELRKRAPDAALIVITGYADLESSLTALRHGAEDYLLKPIDPDQLRMRLARLADLRRAEFALAESNRKLLQSERLAAIGQMMTALIHESRNALQCTQSCLEILSQNLSADQESLELVQRIQKSQHKLHTLFEEVRNYAAPLQLNRSSHDLCDILSETWEDLIWQRQGRSATLHLPDSNPELRCFVDASRMEQVFRNILENSLAACPEPIVIAVKMAATRLGSDDAVKLLITDNGPGLTTEQRSRIFEPFFTTKPTGTGLGMAISKRIVENHGGEIEIGDHSPGTQIVLTLPLAAMKQSLPT
jgi:signal transduction histidine kinase